MRRNAHTTESKNAAIARESSGRSVRILGTSVSTGTGASTATRSTLGDICDAYEKAHVKTPNRRERAQQVMIWNPQPDSSDRNSGGSRHGGSHGREADQWLHAGGHRSLPGGSAGTAATGAPDAQARRGTRSESARSNGPKGRATARADEIVRARSPDRPQLLPYLPTVRMQPDVVLFTEGQVGLPQLIEHVAGKVVEKHQRVVDRIIEDSVLSQEPSFWISAATNGKAVELALPKRAEGR